MTEWIKWLVVFPSVVVTIIGMSVFVLSISSDCLRCGYPHEPGKCRRKERQ